MIRVFTFTGFHMKVFEWHNKTLLGFMDFTSDDEGFRRFKSYISVAVPMTSYILVDILEEDFIREKIPHVMGEDRKYVIERIIDKHFRGNRYVRSQSLGRDKDGRRDDNVLVTALSNIDSLKPWMALFEEYRVPIAGINSLPLLGEKLIKDVAQGEESVLLLSRQMRSAVRESFFKNGQLYLSRQVKLDKSVRNDNRPETLVRSIEKASLSIQKFLSNQRIIGFTETLYIYCILPDDQVDGAYEVMSNSPTAQYIYVSLGQLFSQLHLENCEGQHSDALFSYICTRVPYQKVHYIQEDRRKHFYRFMAQKFVSATTVVASMCLVLITLTMGLHSYKLSMEIQKGEMELAEIQRAYSENYSDLEANLSDAQLIQSAVKHVEYLGQESDIRPQKYFAPLSSVFSDVRFLSFQLEYFSWEKYTPESLSLLVSEVKQSFTVASMDGMEEEYVEYEDDGGVVKQQGVMTIKGYLDPGDLSYRDIVVKVSAFVHTLESLPSVESLYIITSPIDLRPGKRFIDKGGYKHYFSKGISSNNSFEIMLLMQPVKTYDTI